MLQLPKNQPIQQETVQEGQAKKRQRGTGFTGLQKVLGANVGAGQKMGQAIGGQLGQQAEQVRKGIEQGQSRFQTGLQKEQQKRQQTVSAATSAIGDIQKNLEGASNDFYSSVPETEVGSPNLGYADVGQNLRNLQYLGPKSIENIQEQQQRAMNLAALGRLSGMAGGQQQLLKSQVAGRGRYGLGQSSLDALLLGKEGQKQLQAARSETGKIETQAQQAEKMAQAEAQTAESSTEAAKLAAMQKIQQETQGLLNLGSEQAQQYYTTGKHAQDALNKLMVAADPKTVQLTEEEKNALSKAENLGIDVNTIIDTRNPALVNEMVKRISGAGATTYGGGQILTPEQKIALKNLDLLQQGKLIDRKEAERDLFGDVSKETSDLLKQEYENRLNWQNLKNVYDDPLWQKQVRDAGFGNYYGIDPGGGGQTEQSRRNWWRWARDYGGGTRGGSTGDVLGYGLDTRLTNALTNYFNEIEKGEKLYQAQNKVNIKDYINNILGIPQRDESAPRTRLTQK